VWDSAEVRTGDFDVDSGPDDLLDADTDFWASSFIPFTGHTIEYAATNADGETTTHTYAIFSRADSAVPQHFIPYNPGEGDLAPLTGGGASTSCAASSASRRCAWRPDSAIRRILKRGVRRAAASAAGTHCNRRPAGNPDCSG